MFSGFRAFVAIPGALPLAVTLALATGCGSGAASADGGSGRGGSIGSPGQGGSSGSTGQGGESGSTGAGASDASGEAAVSPFVPLFTFSTLAGISAAQVANSADTATGDLGVFASPGDGGTRAAVSWDSTVGSPDVGSLEIQLPCNAYGQFVDYQFILPIITDMGGKTLSVMLRLDSGFSPDAAAPGYVLLYAKSGDNWDWGQTTLVHIAPASAGQWIRYTFPMSTLAQGSSASFDPGYVKAVGLQINTGGGGGVTDPPTPAVFHVDTIGYQ
jgi:hypothetical protein